MPRHEIHPEALTIGQLGKRWNVSAQRVRSLVEAGLLPGTFRIPSAGRFGATTKIPLSSVIHVEAAWSISPAGSQSQVARRRHAFAGTPSLKHFPELDALARSDAEYHADAQR